MNLKAKIGTVLTLSLLLSGCENFSANHEIVRVGNQTFLLNKATGEAKIIEGERLIELKAPSASPTNSTNLDFARKAKEWPEIAISNLGDLKLKVRTKYRDGAMLYAIEAVPYKGVLQKARENSKSTRPPKILLNSYDTDGFPTGQVVELYMTSATQRVNDKGEVMALLWEGRQSMDLDTYKDGAYLEPTWMGFEE